MVGCTPAPPPPPPDTHDADVQALKDNEAQWVQDYRAKDLDRLVAHYVADATLITPGMPPAVGTDAIRGVLKEMVGDASFTLTFQAARVEVSKAGDYGYTQGAYTITMTDTKSKKPMKDSGSYVTVYKKQADGSWKAVSDIASSGPPPAPPAK
jgi:uncharacterized protein (TIGR02246 family)